LTSVTKPLFTNRLPSRILNPTFNLQKGPKYFKLYLLSSAVLRYKTIIVVALFSLSF
jgi:hypothetical protein